MVKSEFAVIAYELGKKMAELQALRQRLVRFRDTLPATDSRKRIIRRLLIHMENSEVLLVEDIYEAFAAWQNDPTTKREKE